MWGHFPDHYLKRDESLSASSFSYESGLGDRITKVIYLKQGECCGLALFRNQALTQLLIHETPCHKQDGEEQEWENPWV